MAYNPTVWVNNQAPALNATNLNKMEQGIKAAHDMVEAVDAAFNAHKSAETLDHPDGSVTDAKIGTRTIDQSQTPSGHGGTLTQLLSRLANRIRAITGKSDWYADPDVTLAATKQHIDANTGVHGVGSAYVAKTSRSDQWPSWSDIPDKPSTYPPSTHSHSVSQVQFSTDQLALLNGDYLILKAPNGMRYKVTVNNNGDLVTTLV